MAGTRVLPYFLLSLPSTVQVNNKPMMVLVPRLGISSSATRAPSITDRAARNHADPGDHQPRPAHPNSVVQSSFLSGDSRWETLAVCLKFVNTERILMEPTCDAVVYEGKLKKVLVAGSGYGVGDPYEY